VAARLFPGFFTYGGHGKSLERSERHAPASKHRPDLEDSTPPRLDYRDEELITRRRGDAARCQSPAGITPGYL